MDHSELLDRCEAWHEAEEYEKIVEALEAIPEEERTTDIDMELARAYNNLGNPGDIEGRRLLKKALGLMEPHESELSDDYSWNFRMGYALIFLEREGEALPHFEKALGTAHVRDDLQDQGRQGLGGVLEGGGGDPQDDGLRQEGRLLRGAHPEDPGHPGDSVGRSAVSTKGSTTSSSWPRATRPGCSSTCTSGTMPRNPCWRTGR